LRLIGLRTLRLPIAGTGRGDQVVTRHAAVAVRGGGGGGQVVHAVQAVVRRDALHVHQHGDASAAADAGASAQAGGTLLALADHRLLQVLLVVVVVLGVTGVTRGEPILQHRHGRGIVLGVVRAGGGHTAVHLTRET